MSLLAHDTTFSQQYTNSYQSADNKRIVDDLTARS